MTKLFSFFALVGVFLYACPAYAEMTSTNFKIRWDSVSTGGSDTASSLNYGLRDSVGGTQTGTSISENHQLSAGYRAGLFDELITFEILPQDTTSQKAVSARSGLTISTSDTSGISIGDYIVLVQDKGVNQISAVGKVTSIVSGSSVTVDSWSDNGTTPTIDGSNDYYSSLSGSSIAFGTLNSSSVSTAVIAFEVTAELDNGYSVQIMQSGNLSNGSHEITPVSDGAVTAGNEEYGARSSDTSLANSTFDTADTAITSSFQDVATESLRKFSDRHFVTLKASVLPSTPSGTYSQAITLIASGNF